MDLFAAAADPAHNLLPQEGEVYYHGPVLGRVEADAYCEALLRDIPWQPDEAIIFGRRIVTARKVSWHGDTDYAYTYSGTTKQALPWTAELRALKGLAERLTGRVYNSCLLNLYHHGGEGMAWHSDDERTLAKDSAIASLSFGAERKFCFRHKRTRETVSLVLEHGSLLVMQGTTQAHWLHRLPPTKKIQTPRVNLTFRLMDTP